MDLLDQPYPVGPIESFENTVSHSKAFDPSDTSVLSLPPLFQVISSTGFNEADKNAIKSMVVALGGRYLPELSKSQTTLLIANG